MKRKRKYSEIENEPDHKEEEQGGDLKTFVKKTSDFIFNPAKRREVISNYKTNKPNTNTVSPTTKSYASAVNEIYKDKEQRKNEIEVDGKKYTLNPKYNKDQYGVYSSGNTEDDDNLFVYRGTKNWKDLVPDLKIATGYENFNDEVSNFNSVRNELGKKNWKILGHSLGATKAMWVGQKENIPTYAFNPGYSHLFEEKLNLTRPDLHLYMVNSDPVSHGLVYEKLNHLSKIYKGKKYLPYSSHSLNYFLN